MKCTYCGTQLMDNSQFCHKCGRPIDSKSSARKVSEETLDIPIDAIERNILSETAAEIKADHRTASRSTPPKKKVSAAAPPQKKSVPAAPPKKKTVYREEEEWDDDDWDDEEEGTDVITIMTAIVGCVILVVVAVLGYHLYQQYAPKSYEKDAQESEEDTAFQWQEMEEGQDGEWTEVSEPAVIVIKNVNVRDYPSTSNSNILKVAQEGEVYPYHGTVDDGEWYEILLDDGTVGYVFHEYVTLDE